MILRELRRRSHRYLMPSLLVCVIAYFVYHLIQGKRGLWALYTLQVAEQDYQKKLADKRAQHAHLLHQVKLMRNESLCPDLLEEQAKQVLGYTHPHEKILLAPTGQEDSTKKQSTSQAEMIN